MFFQWGFTVKIIVIHSVYVEVEIGMISRAELLIFQRKITILKIMKCMIRYIEKAIIILGKMEDLK